MPTDNLVVNNLESVLQVAEEQKIPVIVGETDSVKRGGLLTLGLDYHALGVQTGEMAIRILTEGANPAEMPVEFQKQAKLVINTAAAERMGVTLPQSLLDKADEIAAGLGDHEPQQLREAFAAYAKLDAVADFDARLTAWQRNRI